LLYGGLEMDYSIRQAAELTGLSADTLRYYEREGVVAPRRRENGYRCYDENDIIALKYVVVMKYARFTLSEMKNMEELQTREPDGRCNEIAKRILNAKLAELNQAILNYQKIAMLLNELLPMVESSDAYYGNKEKINAFIEQIFDDIQRRNGGSE